MRTVLAGDLGGTKCRFALVTADYGVHCVERIETVREREPFLQRMAEAVGRVLARARECDDLDEPCAFGIGAAGVVDKAGAELGDPPNLPLGGFGLTAWCERQFALPVTLLNDGRASAWGEFLRGHAAGRDPLLCLFFGTGIGIGLIADGKPFRGGSNAAGEIGHTVYRPGGRVCPCGGRGHFEAYCGGRAMVERAAEELAGAPTGGGHRAPWTVDDLVRCAGEEGERGAIARGILEDAGVAACTLIANATMVFNPNAIVLGGGVLSGWPELRQRLARHVRETTDPIYHRDLTFADSMGGSDAILWGAAAATGALWTA
ncbi:MAG TPA: ROK family protein [bacterium]|nr:ROK family protein [bacterium]